MHIPRKRFGQNFLIDNNIIRRIIQTINPKPEDCVVEIGPGLGALTKELLKCTHRLNVVELDRDIIPKLQAECLGLGELIIHETDILKFDLALVSNEKNHLRVVGNLPYNISTQLIFHLLRKKELIKDMYFMLQHEVVDRIIEAPGSKTYGRLSVMTQYHCQPKKLFVIGSNAFFPAPKVESAIIKLIPHQTLPYLAHDYSRFEIIVREAFNHRRKTIQNALKGVVSVEDLKKANIDPLRRPETLSVEEFVNLANIAG